MAPSSHDRSLGDAPPVSSPDASPGPVSEPGTDPPLGIVGGSAFLDRWESESEDEVSPAVAATLRTFTTSRGRVSMRLLDGVLFLRRHGEDGYRPPHRIPHHAHVLAMEYAGVRQVAGLASTGSLDPEIRPGDVVVPEDYLSRHAPPTFAGDEYLHIVPELDPHIRQLLLEAAHEAMGPEGGRVIDGGVYAETRGPRFETRAEVRALARDASVVGMTAASEATLFQERGLGYACLCIVDNWAHGLGGEPLSLEAFQERQRANSALAGRILHALTRLRNRKVEST